jgi:hypothetical protein
MSVQSTNSKYGMKYLGNSSHSKMEVHDLSKEKIGCQIDEILKANHAVKFVPDTVEEAHKNGYDNCEHCIGGSTR